jgi:hypothetical protein
MRITTAVEADLLVLQTLQWAIRGNWGEVFDVYTGSLYRAKQRVKVYRLTSE